MRSLIVTVFEIVLRDIDCDGRNIRLVANAAVLVVAKYRNWQNLNSLMHYYSTKE